MSARRFNPADLLERPEHGSDSSALDRRAFLGGVGVAAGAVLAASILPIAAAQAGSPETSGAGMPVHGTRALDGAKAAAEGAAPDEPWDIDDMWGHWPRYAQPIPYARTPLPAEVWERIDPVDRALVA